MNGPRRFVITVDGRRHEVSVERGAGDEPAVVTVDGHSRQVTPAADGDMLVRTDADGPQVRVSLPPGPAPTWAGTSGRAHALEVRTAQQAARDEAEAAARGDGSGSGVVQAPMHGRVVKVLVEDGAEVEDNAPLVIIEAMKMENEVRSTRPGTVERVAVAVGDTVEPGQLLLALTAAED